LVNIEKINIFAVDSPFLPINQSKINALLFSWVERNQAHSNCFMNK